VQYDAATVVAQLDVLRTASLPILTAGRWHRRSATGPRPKHLGGEAEVHTDVAVLVAAGEFGKERVVDFAYETEANYWALASGSA